MIKHKTSSDLLAQQTDWQSKSCMFWALELGSIHVKQKKNFVHWKLFPQSDQPAFCHLLCTQCYQKCAAGDHLEMHECAKHWCFMANRIKLSMIPAFSLNLGFLIDALDIKASVHFCLEKMQNTIATNFYLSRGRKLNIKKSNLNQEWGLFKKCVSNNILMITNVVGALSQTSSLSVQRLIQVSNKQSYVEVRLYLGR